MNKIYEHILKARNGHYCHALEVGSAYEMECVIESLIDELGEQFTLADYLDFFLSIELYHLPDEDSSDAQNDMNEAELYALYISKVVGECYDNL